jgi:hypothetical protein
LADETRGTAAALASPRGGCDDGIMNRNGGTWDV